MTSIITNNKALVPQTQNKYSVAGYTTFEI